MNFIVFPREIRKINKRGRGQNKLRGGGGVSKNHEKNKSVPPVYFEPESSRYWNRKELWVQSLMGDNAPGKTVTVWMWRYDKPAL